MTVRRPVHITSGRFSPPLPTVADVWAEGYVAGFVADSDMNSSAVWSDRPAAGSSSNNYANSSNVILSEKPAG